MKTGPERNILLFLMPKKLQERVFPLLCETEMPPGKEIDAVGQKVKFVYFPADCIISLIYVTRDGYSSELSVVGREGIVGTSVLMGAGSTSSQAIVQSAGVVYRLSATDLKREFENDAHMRMLMLRYTQSLITQMAQTAVCNRHHTIEQRLCRWLLLCLDRLPTNELTMTRGLIASMLGMPREVVAQAAGRLQQLGIIRYRRGHITVVNRSRLEALCCECYDAVREETTRLGLVA